MRASTNGISTRIISANVSRQRLNEFGALDPQWSVTLIQPPTFLYRHAGSRLDLYCCHEGCVVSNASPLATGLGSCGRWAPGMTVAFRLIPGIQSGESRWNGLKAGGVCVWQTGQKVSRKGVSESLATTMWLNSSLVLDGPHWTLELGRFSRELSCV
jgi:hypothetical protein